MLGAGTATAKNRSEIAPHNAKARRGVQRQLVAKSVTLEVVSRRFGPTARLADANTDPSGLKDVGEGRSELRRRRQERAR